MELTATASAQRRIGRSTMAILLGLVAGAVLSLGTDQLASANPAVMIAEPRYNG